MSEDEIQANLQRGRNAMWECVSEQKDMTAAMTRPDIGDIDFVWDRDGRGIKHILERRTAELQARPDQFGRSAEETLQKLVEVIARGRLSTGGGKHAIDHDGYRAILAQASKRRNAWLITGFQAVKKGEGR